MIDAYSGVGIVVGDRACLMKTRLVMAIFRLSAALQWVLELKLELQYLVINSYSVVGFVLENRARAMMARLVVAVVWLSAALQQVLELEL